MKCSKHLNDQGEEIISISSLDTQYEVQESFIIKIEPLTEMG
jgi:hypothetical protein